MDFIEAFTQMFGLIFKGLGTLGHPSLHVLLLLFFLIQQLKFNFLKLYNLKYNINNLFKILFFVLFYLLK
jgi:hypothetical protein